MNGASKINILPDGFYDDEDDFDGFDDFGMPTNERYSSETNNRYNLGKESEKPGSKNYLMERLETLLIQNELEPLREFLNNNNHIDLNADLITYSITPLLYATSRGNPDIINELLLNGANPNENREQYTPLMSLCSCRHHSEDELFESATILVEFGALINASNKLGTTPLMMACEKNHIAIVEFLIPYSKIDAVDSIGWSALFYAVSAGNREIVEILIQEGAKTDLIDFRGVTPRQLAVDKNLNDIVKLLSDPTDFEFDLAKLEAENETPNWEDMFPRLKNNKFASFFHDVMQFMYGVNLTRYVQNLQDNNVSFPKLLSITDGELEALGIELPYERRRILHNIHVFHEHKWNERTIYHTPRSNATTFDVLSTVGVINKHILIMGASFKYINYRLKTTKFSKSVQSGEGDSISQIGEKETREQLLQQLESLTSRINSVKQVIARLKPYMKTIEEKTTSPVDFISPNFPCPKYVFVKKLSLLFCTSVIVLLTIRRARSVKSIVERFIKVF